MTAMIAVIIWIPNSGRADNRSSENAVASAAQQAPEPVPDSLLAHPRSLRQIGLPATVTRAAMPRDNPQTDAKIALGEKLFFDVRLSEDGTVACSTCHDPARAFTDARPNSVGIKGRVGQRNAPTILNALYNKTQFWDGRAKTLEAQAALPIVNPSEMGQPNLKAAVSRIAAVAEYQQAFIRVFGRPLNGGDLARGIASYERTLYSFDSPFDRFIAGDRDAIDAGAKRGWEIFNIRGRCNKCHALSERKRDATFFTDNDFHNIGIGIIRHDVVPLACEAKKIIDSGNVLSVDQAAIQTDMSALGVRRDKAALSSG
jgi:cytochrome c peroxidase